MIKACYPSSLAYIFYRKRWAEEADAEETEEFIGN